MSEVDGLVEQYRQWINEVGKREFKGQWSEDMAYPSPWDTMGYEKLLDQIVDEHFMSRTRIVHLRVWDSADEGPDIHITAWFTAESDDDGSYLELVDAVAECDGSRDFFVKDGTQWFEGR